MIVEFGVGHGWAFAEEDLDHGADVLRIFEHLGTVSGVDHASFCLDAYAAVIDVVGFRSWGGQTWSRRTSAGCQGRDKKQRKGAQAERARLSSCVLSWDVPSFVLPAKHFRYIVI